jgi:hypothetical protein
MDMNPPSGVRRGSASIELAGLSRSKRGAREKNHRDA